MSKAMPAKDGATGRGEHWWPVASAVVVAAVLHVALPAKHRVAPRWVASAVLFAATYVVLAALSAANFGEHLSHTGGLYFTVTVFPPSGSATSPPRPIPPGWWSQALRAVSILGRRARSQEPSAVPPPAAPQMEELKSIARDLRNAANENFQAALEAARLAEESARSHRLQIESFGRMMAAYEAALANITAPSTIND